MIREHLFLSFVALAVGLAAYPQASQGAFHLMQIEQVIAGVNGDTTAQAIQLRMRSVGQNVLGGARMRVFDATGANPIVVVDFNANVPSGASGARVLISSAAFNAATSPMAVPNFAMANLIPPSYLAAGSLTFETDGGFVYWRLSWGGAGYTGPTTGAIDNDADGQYGPPFAGPLPSTTLQALQFQGIATAPSTNNAANYALTAGAAVFVNNAGASFTVNPPAPTGACCDDNTGNCTNAVTQASCEGGGNRYGGDASTCGTIDPPCTGPTGACCDDDTGICTEGSTEADCLSAGSRYGGDDSTCGTIDPPCTGPVGACCDEVSGACMEGLSETQCDADGGRFGGAGSTCGDIDPPCEPQRLQILVEPVAGVGALRSAGTTLAAPIHVTHAGDGSGRLFIVDQSGLIRVVDAGGNLLTTPFLDVTGLLFTPLGDIFDERGLLGLAFHPDYETNGRFFIRYSAPRTSTGMEPCDLSGFNPGCHKEVLAEYQVSGDPNVADPGSAQVLFEVDEPQFNHNAGMVEFGPDGFLYFSLGDGGGAHDGLADGDPPGSSPSHGPNGNGQNIDTALGSLLRIDVDSPPAMGLEYAIPPDNPFVGTAGLDEIYAYGFRNPFRFSFDDGPGGTDDLYLADVGQDLFEEVDIVELGGNYGWVIREGFECFDPFNPGAPPVSCPTMGALGEPLLDPVSVYTHAEGGLAILGGYVYRGGQFPELVGRYVYGDFSADFGPTGRLYYFDTTGPNAYQRREFIIAPDNLPLGLFAKGLGRDEAGELYVCASSDLAPSGTSGVVFRIVRPPAPPAAEPAGVAKNRALGVLIPQEQAARRGPGAMTAIRVTLTSLNHPRFCCTGQDGNGFGTGCDTNTPCDTDSDCPAMGTSLCRPQLAPGAPFKCCSDTTATSCHPIATCQTDANCAGVVGFPECEPMFKAFEGKIRYVNSFPGGSLVCQDDGLPFNTTYRCATLGCDPEYRDWATDLGVAVNPAAPAGLIYITGDAVVPSSILHVQHMAVSCGAAPGANTCSTASTALAAGTANWGDITRAAFGVPDGRANVLDLPAVTNKLKGVTPFFPEYRTWLKQADPAANTDSITVVDLSDVQDAILAKPYPASRTPDACPHD